MKLLSISTASDILSLSLVDGNNLISSFSSEGNKRHAELISPKIREIMNASGYKFADLDGICVNLGPGSFTGLRVGLSTAKGLVYGSNLKLFVYTNFEELIYQAVIEKVIKGRGAVLIHSRKNEFYFGAFEIGENRFHQLDAFELMNIDDLKNHSHHFDFLLIEKKISPLILGDLKNIKILVLENNSYFGALLIQNNPQKYFCENYFYLEPLYLKNFDVKLKK